MNQFRRDGLNPFSAKKISRAKATIALLSMALTPLSVISNPIQARAEQYPVAAGNTIAQGDFHVCYITIEGNPNCWGQSQQAATVPQGIGLAETIAASSDTTCVVTTLKDIRCWGDIEFTRINPKLSPIRTLVAITQSGKVCFAITNEITCNGVNMPAMNMRSNLTQLVAGSNFICVLNDEQKVNCKDFSGDYLAFSGESTLYTPETLRLTAISAGKFHACGIEVTAQATCWGVNTFGQTQVPSDLASSSQVSAGATHSCALSTLSQVRCWGSNSFGQLDVPENLGTVLEVSAGNNRTCVVLEDKGPMCWGRNYDSLSPPRDVFFTQVSTSNSHTCGVSIDNELFCWGSNGYGQVDLPPNLGEVSKAIVTDRSTCVITMEGTPLCWGSVPQEIVESMWWDMDRKPIKSISVYQGSHTSDTICLIAEDGQGGCDSPYYSGVSSIGVSNYSECILRVAGNIECSGFNWWGRHNIPENLTSVTQLSINSYGACALSTSDLLNCWGFEGVQWGPNFVSELPSGVSFQVVEVGGVFACGIKNDSNVQCWGSNEYGQSSVPDNLGPVVDISSSYNHTCAATLLGEIKCWGLLENSQVEEPNLKPVSILRGLNTLPQPLISGLIRVGSKVEAVPGVWDAGVELNYQWMLDHQPIDGATSKIYTPTPEDLGKYLTVDVTGSKSGYRSETSGSLGKGVEPGRMDLTAELEVLGVFRVGSLLKSEPLDIDDNYDVSFQWMRDNLAIPEATESFYRVQPDDRDKALRLRATVSKFGYLGTKTFFSNSEVVTLNVPGAATGAVIVIGKEHRCFLLSSAQPVCRLSESMLNDEYYSSRFNFGQADVPSDLGSVTELAAGEYHTCALIDFGTVRCWGNNENNQTDVPEDLEEIVQISASGNNTCAVSKLGQLSCWGSSDNNQLAFPEDLGAVTQIAVGESHTCAVIQLDFTVRCWGDNFSGQLEAPVDLGAVNQVAVGFNHTCAIDVRGAVNCWGSNSEGQLTPPANLGATVQVAAGWSHTCAVTVNTEAVCWGSNYAFESEVPFSSTFFQLTASGQNTCGLYSDSGNDNKSICWGVNRDSEESVISPPTISGELGLEILGESRVGNVLMLNVSNQPQGTLQAIHWTRNGVEIPGMNGNSYMLTLADANQIISAKVFSFRPWSKPKFELAQELQVQPLKMTIIGEPRISGVASVGSILTANEGIWDEGVKFSYQWLSGSRVVGTKSLYTLTKADLGKPITLQIQASKTGHEDAFVISTSVVGKVGTFTKAKVPQISGVARVGKTLKCITSGWIPAAKVTYQWYLDGKKIKGAIGSTFKAIPAHKKHKLSVVVTQSSSGYLTKSLSSKLIVVG